MFHNHTLASKVKCLVKKVEWKKTWGEGYLSPTLTAPLTTPSLSLRTHHHHNHTLNLSLPTHLLQYPDPAGLLLPGGPLGTQECLPLFLKLANPLLQPRDL